tara:strand:- start:407 stop:1579 length:1173 start_codon:yes stop_codon:yes gene_type:complete
MKAKTKKVVYKSFLSIVAVFVAAFMLTQTVQAANIGPLPKIKINAKKAELGRKLFFDTKLSGDALLACSSCHDHKLGFTTRKPLSDGYVSMLHFRNAPTLINTAYKGGKTVLKNKRIPWHWDGRLGTNLNDMTRDALVTSETMNMDMRIMQERLRQFPAYVIEFNGAFGAKEPSNGLVRKAIPEFLKTLTSKNVPFDKGKLDSKAKAGLNLFKGKAGCIRCHNGPMFTDGKPHNTGVPENPEVFKDPVRHVTLISLLGFSQGLENIMNIRRDPGYMTVSHDAKDMGKFSTPTLRELKYTAPYMHNGMMDSLDKVIDFYNKGGGPDRPGLKDVAMVPLRLTNSEKAELKSFLLALSGDDIGAAVKYEKPDLDYKPLPNWVNNDYTIKNYKK